MFGADVWDKARRAVGGDDFVEVIPHETCVKMFRFAPDQARTFSVKVTSRAIEFTVKGLTVDPKTVPIP